MICWMNGAWHVRDLASTNGTFFQGRGLVGGDYVRLQAGEVMAFGDEEQSWALCDASPPRSIATNLETGEQRVGSLEWLCLPSLRDPVVQAILHPDGEWVLEERGEQRPVKDGGVVRLAEAWRLSLPSIIPSTEVVWGDDVLLLSDSRIVFRVTEDGHVRVVVYFGEKALRLPDRSHHQLLLRLAWKRMGDRRRDPDGSEDEHGWIEVEELARRTYGDAAKRNLLDQHINRARRLFHKEGIMGAPNLIERRTLYPGGAHAGTHQQQVRIGVSSLEVENI